MTTSSHMEHILSLPGLRPAPSQVWRSVRLVPLLRDPTAQHGDLRLGLRPYDELFSAVTTKGRPSQPKQTYFSVIPHGMIVGWNEDREPLVSWNTSLEKASKTKDGESIIPNLLGHLHRQVKRSTVHKNRARFLPLHLAMEGLLSLHFGGPDVLFDYYSNQVKRHGLSPRHEFSVPGKYMPDLREALSLFEILENQCGVVLYLGDSLASVFVVPTHADYRMLHDSLIQDFFAEALIWAASYYNELPTFALTLDQDLPLDSLEQIQRHWEEQYHQWGQFELTMAQSLLEREILIEDVYTLGPFKLQRFITNLLRSNSTHEHIGEMIRRDDGSIEYLKTYRLGTDQATRAALLMELAQHHWDFLAMAKANNIPPSRLFRRFHSSELGHMFHQHGISQLTQQHG